MTHPPLRLAADYDFAELLQPQGIQRLDQDFLRFLKERDAALHTDLQAYRAQGEGWPAQQTSTFILALAPYVEQFLGWLYGIDDHLAVQKLATLTHEPILAFKQWYVQREAKRRLRQQESQDLEFSALDAWLSQELATEAPLLGLQDLSDKELAVATLGQRYLQDTTVYEAPYEQLINWCVAAMLDPEGQAAVKDWVSFHLPQRRDYTQLISLESCADQDQAEQVPIAAQRQRDGFALTDPRMGPRQVQDEVHYCVYCHDKEGDFCSKGFPVKKAEPEQGLKQDALGEMMTGCPLEEKISEMNLLKRDGWSIAALAVVMIDNPMCPATGHRICNDCMKACIYQKQDPVDIPQIETRVLMDVLHLPWGVELYGLLTRWNPLRHKQWALQPYNGYNVAVMGMGPAGFTLAHHLLMEGCAVVGFDGLKIEALPQKWVENPIYRYADIEDPLDKRINAGFGGVAEYGITVRWDKNLLKIIYLSLIRHQHFQVAGGVRFGGTLRVEDAWRLGFHHLAIAVGAGLPRELPIPGSMAPGMRQANDFLMALQLTGAAKEDSLASLQLRMPIRVIGSGLTAVDTATEAKAYYIAQVEKIYFRYQLMIEKWGESDVRGRFHASELQQLDECLAHGKAVFDARAAAESSGVAPDFNALCREWGGVSLVYRKRLQDSPAYRLNHEELQQGLNEGILYQACLSPKAVTLDAQGHVAGLKVETMVQDAEGVWQGSGEERTLAAGSILVATGAQPNIAYEYEHRGTFIRQQKFYQAYALDAAEGAQSSDLQLNAVDTTVHCKVPEFGPLTSYEQRGHRVSFVGDTHPSFHGSVVKAIASAMRSYPTIMRVLRQQTAAEQSQQAYQAFAQGIATLATARVVESTLLNASVTELVIHAPLAVHNYEPGHFYRLQNFERTAPIRQGTRLHAEALALQAFDVNKQAGTLKLLVVARAANSRVVAQLKPGEKVALMGPGGVRSKLPTSGSHMLLVADITGVAHMLAMLPALKEAGVRTTCVIEACQQTPESLQARVSACADAVVWVAADQQEVGLPSLLAQSDSPTFHTMQLMGAFPMVKRWQYLRHHDLAALCAQDVRCIAAVQGPMQCMLKGVCAQCLQWQVDPQTGQRTKAVYACSWQDQPVEMIDMDHLAQRSQHNRVQDVLNNAWLDWVLAQGDQHE